MSEPAPIYVARSVSSEPSGPAITPDHITALDLVITHYGFWLPGWPPDRVRQMLQDIKAQLS